MSNLAVVHAMERLARFQFAVAGDCLEWSLAQTGAALAAKNPLEFVARQLQLSARIGARVQQRTAAFVQVSKSGQETVLLIAKSEILPNLAEDAVASDVMSESTPESTSAPEESAGLLTAQGAESVLMNSPPATVPAAAPAPPKAAIPSVMIAPRVTERAEAIVSRKSVMDGVLEASKRRSSPMNPAPFKSKGKRKPD